jgi:hypothetical protein
VLGHNAHPTHGTIAAVFALKFKKNDGRYWRFFQIDIATA